MSFLDILRQLSHGVGYTLLVTLACSVTGLFSGLLIAGARQLGGAGAALLLDVYTYIFRGIPVLVLLFVVYFGLPGLGLKVAPLLAMMLSLGLIAGAYLAEVFRGALGSVDPSEILAATASGMTRGQIFFHIELPQMLRFAVPGTAYQHERQRAPGAFAASGPATALPDGITVADCTAAGDAVATATAAVTAARDRLDAVMKKRHEAGERLRIMRHCPLKSSSSAMSRRISGVMLKTGGNMAVLAVCLADYSRLWLIRQTYFFYRSLASTQRHQGRETPGHPRTPMA